MDRVISVKDLSVSFHQGESSIQVIKNVSFDINESETLALVGESGSGKSITAHSLMRLLPYPLAYHPTGEIWFEDQNLIALSQKAMRHIRGNRIGMIFQEPISALNPLHTVEKQIGEALCIHRGFTKKTKRNEVLNLLDHVRIRDPETKLKAFPHQLSGGQRQRVMIAMALANNPRLLIADEPTTALDVTVQKDILDLLKDLQQEHKMSILLITHDLGVVRYSADQVLVMQNGHIVESQTTTGLFKQPQHNYTKTLINSHSDTQPIKLEPPIHQLKPVMATKALCVDFPTSKPLFGQCKSFFHALKNVDLTLAEGSTLGIVGESGSGKSTLAFAMLRLLKSKGGIFFDGKPIQDLTEKTLRPLRSQIQIVFQDPFSSLSPRMSIKSIISEGLLVHHHYAKAEVDQKVDDIMREVDLDPATKNRYPHEFSGGQRQRIAIARALILNPRVIFLDEPTSALDRNVQAQVIGLLRKLQAERKLSYLLISHDMQVIQSISHKVMVINQGEIVEQGETQQIFDQPQHVYTQKLLAATLN